MENNTNYSARFGNMNLLTDEEKSSYRDFAQKVHNMSHKDVYLLNSDMRDKLTTEQQDIVAWELKIRELDIYKKKNIKPEEVFNVYKVTGNVEYDYDNPNLMAEKMAEKKAMIGMDDKLLEESKRILENNPVVISSNNLHNIHGGGVNIMANKYIVEDDNGKRITIDNKKIQEHYRKMYIKAMSEATGIDYTQYDLSGDDDPNIDYMDPLVSVDHSPIKTSPDDYTNIDIANNININDYEDE